MLFKAIAVKERYKDPAGKVIGYKIRDYLNQKDTLVSEDQLINAIKEDLVEPVNFKLTGNEGSELVYINGSQPLGTQFDSRYMIDHGLELCTNQSDPKQRYVVYKPLNNIFRHEWFLMDEQQNTYNISTNDLIFLLSHHLNIINATLKEKVTTYKLHRAKNLQIFEDPIDPSKPEPQPKSLAEIESELDPEDLEVWKELMREPPEPDEPDIPPVPPIPQVPPVPAIPEPSDPDDRPDLPKYVSVDGLEVALKQEAEFIGTKDVYDHVIDYTCIKDTVPLFNSNKDMEEDELWKVISKIIPSQIPVFPTQQSALDYILTIRCRLEVMSWFEMPHNEVEAFINTFSAFRGEAMSKVLDGDMEKFLNTIPNRACYYIDTVIENLIFGYGREVFNSYMENPEEAVKKYQLPIEALTKFYFFSWGGID